MLRRQYGIHFSITTRPIFASIVLISNAFIWYSIVFTRYFGSNLLDKFAYELALSVWVSHFVGVVLSAIIGAKLIDRFQRRSDFLTIWMIFGMLSTLSLLWIDSGGIIGILLLSLIFGVSFGLGSPVSMGYFADCTTVENRAKLGGLTMLVSGLGVFLLGAAADGNMILQPIIPTIWRGIGLLIFLIVKPLKRSLEKEKKVSYQAILNQRQVMLYLIPWLMFSLANYLGISIQHKALVDMLGSSNAATEQLKIFHTIEGVLAGAFSIVGGLLSDSIGRKRVTIFGFVQLGLGYAVLGIYHMSLFTWYFYTIVDGVAWGIFSLIFITTVWGDLSHGASSDRYYAVGGLPFFLSNLANLLASSYIAEIIQLQAIFSLAAFFIFMAVIPLMYAPETLPEKKIRERELRKYVQRAKKIKEKYS